MNLLTREGQPATECYIEPVVVLMKDGFKVIDRLTKTLITFGGVPVAQWQLGVGPPEKEGDPPRRRLVLVLDSPELIQEGQ